MSNGIQVGDFNRLSIIELRYWLHQVAGKQSLMANIEYKGHTTSPACYAAALPTPESVGMPGFGWPSIPIRGKRNNLQRLQLI